MKTTNCKTLYKTPLCDKKSKWPLSSLSYHTCSILSPCLFPRHPFVLQWSWLYSALPPLTHTELCGGQVLGRNSSLLVKVSEKKGECLFILKTWDILVIEDIEKRDSCLKIWIPTNLREDRNNFSFTRIELFPYPHMIDPFPHSCTHLK